MPKTKRYFSPEYSFFPVLFCFVALQITHAKLHFCGLSMLSSTKCTSENTKYKHISRRVAVSLLTNVFNKKRLLSENCAVYLL